MPYYSRPGDDDVDDFDEFDPTPYGGGFDLFLTYGRPLEPSDEICYPSSNDGDFDYSRPNFSGSSDHFAYSDETLQNEYSCYTRPKPRPNYGIGSAGAQYESGHGRRRPEYEESESGYRRKPDLDRPGSEFESGLGGGVAEYGTGHRRLNESEYGSGYDQGRQSYGRKDGDSDDEKKKSSYGYGGEEGYGDNSDDEKKKSSYGYGGEEGYGRKKDDSGSDDDEEKKRHHHKHHHHKRRDSDDDE